MLWFRVTVFSETVVTEAPSTRAVSPTNRTRAATSTTPRSFCVFLMQVNTG